MTKRVLVTGAAGCIGAWVCRGALRRGWSPVAADIDTAYRRWSQLMSDDEMAEIPRHALDICDAEGLALLTRSEGIDQIIHTAALQVPFNRADPTRGARVNVVGTVNVFEATRRAGLGTVVYASSVAVFGPASDYPDGIVPANAAPRPSELYGVNKVCNEGTARVYWEHHQVASVGVRPHTVYGPGRDAGMTSEPTQAIRSAADREPYHISYGGRSGFHYVEDVADLMLDASSQPDATAEVYNLAGDIADMADFVRAIETALPDARGLITHSSESLALPSGMDDSELQAAFDTIPNRPIRDGVAATAEVFATARRP